MENSKGQIIGIFVVLAVLMIAALIIVAGTVFLSVLRPALLSDTGPFQDSSQFNFTQIVDGYETVWSLWAQYLVVAYFLFGGAVIWYLNEKIESSQMLLIVSLLLIAPLLMGAAYVANSYSILEDIFPTAVAEHPALTALMQHLVEITMAFMVVAAYVYYRSKSGVNG